MTTRENIERTAKDFMCYPQLGHDPFRNPGETFAQALRDHILWVLEDSDDHDLDPMDAMVIY